MEDAEYVNPNHYRKPTEEERAAAELDATVWQNAVDKLRRAQDRASLYGEDRIKVIVLGCLADAFGCITNEYGRIANGGLIDRYTGADDGKANPT